MRLDQYLVSNSLSTGRDRAKYMIKNGEVNVNGKVCIRPAFNITDKDIISIESDTYFSRGELKLNKALESFNISCNGKICVDIGACTGGFTYSLLKHGAKEVYAVDVGHDQLRESLRLDERVLVLEGYNARYLKADDIGGKRELFVIDVSFISLELIIPPVIECLREDGDIIALVKPQFETKGLRIKNGIVKDKSIHKQILHNIQSLIINSGCHIADAVKSPVSGGDGNIEYLLHIKHKTENNNIDICKLIE